MKPHRPTPSLSSMTATSNLSGVSRGFTLADLENAKALVAAMPPREEQVHNFNAGSKYYAALCGAGLWKTPPDTMFGSRFGFNVYLDPDLPPNVCEFRNHKGEVLYADTLNTTSAPEAQ